MEYDLAFPCLALIICRKINILRQFFLKKLLEHIIQAFDYSLTRLIKF